MKNPYHTTLEDLAEKRRNLVGVIVNLAHVAGVDPAPYLDDVTNAIDRDAQPPKTEDRGAPPARPSKARAGKGKAAASEFDQMLDELQAKALDLLAKSGGKMKPGDLYQKLNLMPANGRKVLAALGSKVSVTGATISRMVRLTSRN